MADAKVKRIKHKAEMPEKKLNNKEKMASQVFTKTNISCILNMCSFPVGAKINVILIPDLLLMKKKLNP